MNAKGKYLKDENGTIFSPVASGDTVFYNTTQSINDFVGNFYLDYQSDMNGIQNFGGTKSGSNGGCSLPNGLVLNWGSVNTNTFNRDTSTGDGYSLTITFKYPYTTFNAPIACFRYNNGIDQVGVHHVSLIQITLVSKVKVNGFYVNWFCIGI